jgi:hypothetical protein
MMPERSILDARLAEIDRRLRTIQSGLAPAAESPPPPLSFPSPTLVPPAEAASRRHGAADMATALRELIAGHERLLAAARELLSSFESEPEQAGAPQPVPSRAREPVPAVSVAAGPFPNTEALRRFETSLASLSEVRDVVVREYVGEDRAVVDVHLFTPTS